MRKNYVKPTGNLVALQMDENIALSLGFKDIIYNFNLSYTFTENGKFIKNTDVPSRGVSGVVGSTLDLFVLVDAIADRLQTGNPVTGWENCNTNPEVTVSL